MWFRTIFRRSRSAPDGRRPTTAEPSHGRRAPVVGRRPAPQEPPLFDEAFLRRLERMSLQAQRTLRGNLGVRYVKTEQTSDGYTFIAVGQAWKGLTLAAIAVSDVYVDA